MRPMAIAVIAFSLLAVVSQIANAKQTYTLQQYPEDFANANIPCGAFKRNANGSWKEVAVFVFNGQRFTGNSYAAGSREAGIINQKCGAK